MMVDRVVVTDDPTLGTRVISMPSGNRPWRRVQEVAEPEYLAERVFILDEDDLLAERVFFVT